MADFQVKNDTVVTATILAYNSAGVVEPAPSGDTFSVTSSDASSLAVSIGSDANGAPAVVMTPLVQSATGITVEVSDSSGLKAFQQLVDIVQDTSPVAIGLDLADATTTPQSVPSNPGPGTSP